MASMVKLAGCMMEPSLSPVPVTLHSRAIVGPRCTRVRAACGDDGEDGIAMEPAGSGGTASAPPSMACRHLFQGRLQSISSIFTLLLQKRCFLLSCSPRRFPPRTTPWSTCIHTVQAAPRSSLKIIRANVAAAACRPRRGPRARACSRRPHRPSLQDTRAP